MKFFHNPNGKPAQHSLEKDFSPLWNQHYWQGKDPPYPISTNPYVWQYPYFRMGNNIYPHIKKNSDGRFMWMDMHQFVLPTLPDEYLFKARE